MGKGENDHYEEFPTFPQFFKRHMLQTCKNKGFEKRDFMLLIDAVYLASHHIINSLPHNPDF